MKVAELETILNAEDVRQRVQLRCLSCRRRLAGVSLTDRFMTDGSTGRALSVSLLSEDLRDFQQSPQAVALTCGCGVRSSYFLV